MSRSTTDQKKLCEQTTPKLIEGSQAGNISKVSVAVRPLDLQAKEKKARTKGAKKSGGDNRCPLFNCSALLGQVDSEPLFCFEIPLRKQI